MDISAAPHFWMDERSLHRVGKVGKGTFSISAPGLQSIRKQGLTEMMTMLNTDNGNYDTSSSLP